jgi:hypothetical protein
VGQCSFPFLTLAVVLLTVRQRVALALGIAFVVACSEGVLFVLWQARGGKKVGARERRRAVDAHRKKDVGAEGSRETTERDSTQVPAGGLRHRLRPGKREMEVTAPSS